MLDQEVLVVQWGPDLWAQDLWGPWVAEEDLTWVEVVELNRRRFYR